MSTVSEAGSPGQSETTSGVCHKPTTDIGLIIGMGIGAILGAFLFGPIGFIIFSIIGMILGDETEQEITKYYKRKTGG